MDKKGITSFCENHKGKAKTLKRKFKSEKPEFQRVERAFGSSLEEGCRKILSYYKKQSIEERLPFKVDELFEEKYNSADKLLEYQFNFRGVLGKIKRTPEGIVIWDDYGPKGDIEWAYFLNRHFFLLVVMEEHKKTGDSRYIRYIDKIMKNWILENPPPKLFYRKSVQWRVLEAGLRILVVWIELFYYTLHQKEFSNQTSLLMLHSIYKHLRYLRWWPARHGNHLIMEMDALATGCLAFTEIKNSNKWLMKARKRMTKQLTKVQVYPDGVQNELTAHYHQVALQHFEHFAKVIEKTPLSVSDNYKHAMEMMWNYLVYAMRPNGTPPLNNDSNLIDNREKFKQKAEEYNRPDWLYIATNGKEGIKPREGKVNYFPWAGQLITRSGFRKNEIWSYFECGPWGMAHQHRDKMHLSIHAYGRDILVDSGIFRYKRDRWRDRYFQASRGHNVVLVDGRGQKPTKHKIKKKPNRDFREEDDCVYISDSYEKGFADEKVGIKGRIENPISGTANHKRSLIYIKEKYWLVLDEIESDRTRDLKWLWHFHPNCTVEIDYKDNKVFTSDAETGNILLIPFSDRSISWNLQVVSGQEEPKIQGWYSPKYNQKVSAPCLEAGCSVKFPNEDNQSIRLVWLVLPFKDTQPNLEGTIIFKNHKIDVKRSNLRIEGKPVSKYLKKLLF